MAKRRATVRVASTRGPTRVQQAAEFSAKKNKLRRKQFKRRSLMVAGIAVVAYVGIGGWWLSHTGKIEKAANVTSDAFWGMTADAGFKLGQVYLTGREHADIAVVKAALNAQPGAPILAMDLQAIQAKLQEIPEVKSATISRQLPGALSVALVERQPAAVWQREGKHMLVDEEGVVLASDSYKPEQPLPVVVGDDAPQHVEGLVKLLNAAPALKPQVVAAVRIGSRRWNVQLQNGVTVMLPQDGADDAWKRFSQLVDREGLLTKAVSSVDMRMEDRVFIMPAEQQKNPITLTTARDT